MAAGCGDDDADQVTAASIAVSTTTSTPTATTTTNIAATSSTTAAPSTTSAPSMTTTSTDPSTTVDSGATPPIGAVARVDGLGTIDADGTYTQVVSTAAAIAFILDSDTIVAQARDPQEGLLYPPLTVGPVVVIKADATTELAGTAEDGSVTLLDVNDLDHSPVALAAFRQPNNGRIDEHYELIDLTTAERTDLGSTNGAVSVITGARLGPDGILAVGAVDATVAAVLLEPDGTVRWETTIGSDTSITPAWIPGRGPSAIEIATNEDFSPRLTITTFDPATGDIAATDELTVTSPPEDPIEAGICFTVEPTDNNTIICDRTAAGPIEIDLDNGQAAPFTSLDGGIPTLAR